MLNRAVLVASIGAIIAGGMIAAFALSATAASENIEIGSEEWINALELREQDAVATALADPRVQKYTDNAYNVSHDFTPHELKDSPLDELVVHIVVECQS